ncbi:hypothetical protein OPV22_007337 [Ensete ventricosum]|uniref:Uncharacterized protein n=1 Tax=Ensete ventricosum TaxID=4639 RepID=A0AAV8RMP4_ENSVE|nr:hypothetical protein OPV22_007337 [Ensete ventricosum]
MAALGEQSEAVFLPELARAHRAIGALDRTIAFLASADSDVTDHGLVEPIGLGPGRGRPRGELKVPQYFETMV